MRYEDSTFGKLRYCGAPTIVFRHMLIIFCVYELVSISGATEQSRHRSNRREDSAAAARSSFKKDYDETQLALGSTNLTRVQAARSLCVPEHHGQKVRRPPLHLQFDSGRNPCHN